MSILPFTKPRLLLGFLLLMGIVLQVQGQQRLAAGSGPPPIEGYAGQIPDWYLDTLTHRVYKQAVVENDVVWWSNPFPLQSADGMDQCAGVVIFSNAVYHWGYAGRTELWRFQDYLCGDSLLIVWSKGLFMTYVNGVNLNPGYDVERPDCWTQQVDLPDTLLGKPTLCVALRLPHQGAPLCGTLRTWGMIDRNGNWVIQPQYDHSFRFVNGVAEVVYYGQKRKINERGEFIDTPKQ